MSTGPASTSSPPESPTGLTRVSSLDQTQKAIHAMQNKQPIADIDFTLHVMEDGTEVSTVERVCKGISLM
jgi:serine/threonine-protein phosphatase 2B catalytic subunit